MQRNFEPLMRRIDAFREYSLTDDAARLVIYRAFIAEELAAPRHLARVVDGNYFHPAHDDFKPRTMWSLESAFTSAFFHQLEPVSRMKTTASLARFMGAN